jgi:replicative DNA helicase
MTKKKDLSVDELRLPPHSIEAEQSVIGGLLRDNNAWDRIGGQVSAGDFYRYDHRIIFQEVIKLITAGKPADVITVHEQLAQLGKADDCGGLVYLNAMAQNTPSAANIGRYAEIVRNRGVLRNLITAALEICDDAYRMRDEDVSGLLDQAEARILAIAEERARGSDGAVALQPLLTEVVEQIDALYSRDDPSEITGMPTGFTDLDKLTSGLQDGNLVVVAGRPAMGKTAFAINIGENVAVEAGKPVVVFSMEMGGTELARRILSSTGKLDAQRLRSGRLADDDWPRLTHAIQKLNEAQVFIDETPALSPIEVRSRARRLARKHGKLGLVIVDYLQLMVGSNKDQGKPENRATEVAEISRGLKALAKELKCPVIALSQLNRELEKRPNKRPVMSDLRESGAIEQDADVIIFLYRDEVYNPDSEDKGTAEIIIGKQRAGPIGTVRLTWIGEHTRFANYSSMSRQ